MPLSTRLIINILANCLQAGSALVVAFVVTPILLKQLGAEGFGLLMTLGASGFMFAICVKTLGRSVQREMAYALGVRDEDSLSKAFSTTFFLQLSMAVVFGLLFYAFSETILRTITIPEGWEFSARICLIITIVNFSLAIAVSPYMGLLTAHQQFRTIAVFDTCRDVSRLLVALSLFVVNTDPLIHFIVGNFVLGTLISVAMVWTVLRRFSIALPRIRHFSFAAFRSIFRYGSISFFGMVAGQLRTQGAIVFTNVVFGNVTTSAFSISVRAGEAFRRLMGVISRPVQPAMTTGTAEENTRLRDRLATLSSSVSFAFALVICFPVIIDAEVLLRVWLGEYPAGTPIFVRICCISVILGQISIGQNMALHADGRIGALVLINQIVIVALLTGAAIYSYATHSMPWLIALSDAVGVFISVSIFQPWWASRKLSMDYQLWIRKTLIPSIFLTVLLSLTAFVICVLMPSSLLRVIVLFLMFSAVAAIMGWLILIDENERKTLMSSVVLPLISRSSGRS